VPADLPDGEQSLASGEGRVIGGTDRLGRAGQGGGVAKVEPVQRRCRGAYGLDNLGQGWRKVVGDERVGLGHDRAGQVILGELQGQR